MLCYLYLPVIFTCYNLFQSVVTWRIYACVCAVACVLVGDEIKGPEVSSAHARRYRALKAIAGDVDPPRVSRTPQSSLWYFGLLLGASAT